MSTNHYPIEIPILTPIAVEPVMVETQIQEVPTEPTPVAVCIFNKYGKPLEAKPIDVGTKSGRKTLYELTTHACFDELSVIVWPDGGKSPLLASMDLLRRMVARYNLGHFQDNAFLSNWIKEANTILIDFKDIDELLTFVEPVRNSESEDMDLDHE